jgi:hypothetical protein
MSNGRCVICGQVGPLTEDHVPPRSVSPPNVLEINHLPDLLVDIDERPRTRGGFQAPKFPSLCRICNNEKLGREYDPVLAKFVGDVRPWVRIVERGIFFQSGITVTTKPLRLARAVVGHLLAAEERSNPSEGLVDGRIPNLMRAFFLDSAAPWPNDLFFHLWPYTGQEQIIFRGLGIVNMFRGTILCGDLLKFFPMAFLITIDSRSTNYTPPLLPLGGDLGLDSEIDLRLPATNLPPHEWPQYPGSFEGILLNDRRTLVSRIRR